jgi:hypothetical protein
MPQQDARAAARDRDSGLRKVSKLTWRAGAAGVAFSAIVGVAFTHHAGAAASTQARHARQPNSIVIPAQPPQQSSGTGQVTSGAS